MFDQGILRISCICVIASCCARILAAFPWENAPTLCCCLPYRSNPYNGQICSYDVWFARASQYSPTFAALWPQYIGRLSSISFASEVEWLHSLIIFNWLVCKSESIQYVPQDLASSYCLCFFSCPGSSIPDLGQWVTGWLGDWVTATLEFWHKEWLLRLETLQTFDRHDI